MDEGLLDYLLIKEILIEELSLGTGKRAKKLSC
jgi:hypothetical protein